jgi:hypothetical protein
MIKTTKPSVTLALLQLPASIRQSWSRIPRMANIKKIPFFAGVALLLQKA